LDGVGPDGHVIALLNSRLLRGPRWVLVRSPALRAGTFDEVKLSELGESSHLADALNRGWSNWILDRDAWSRLFEAGTTGVSERIAWCRGEHPPREQRSVGPIREAKLAAALQEFRDRVDAAAPGGTGSQIEGQIHQALLGDVLGQLGYAITPNPVGVPDIVAKRQRTASAPEIAKRLAAWKPRSSRLRAARAALEGLDSGELIELARVLSHDRRQR